jgi:serine phosphatase RsbU (regulator of sigma subunit)
VIQLFRSLISSGVTPTLSASKAHKIVLTNQTALLFSVLSIPYFIIFRFFGLEAVSWSVVPSAIILMSCILLNRFHFYNLSRFSIIVVSNAIGFFYVYSVGKNSGLPLVYFALLFMPLVLFGLKEFWQMTFGTLLTFASFTLSHVLSPSASPFYFISETYMHYLFYTSGALAFGIIFSYLCLYQYQQDVFSDKILAANVELEEKHQQDREFQFTSEIQQRLLPQSLPQFEHVACDAVFVPARKVSGDFYDFIETEAGHLSFVVADIVGKGLPACLAMVTLKSIIHHFFSQRHLFQVAINQLNQLIDANPVISRFVPLFFGDLDVHNKTLSYTNAGHEPALLYSGGQWIELSSEPHHVPLGADPSTIYQVSTIQLNPGDILVFFTDGAPEARNATKDAFGIERIKSVITQNTHVDRLAHRLYESIYAFSQGTPQHDDITIVTMRIK